MVWKKENRLLPKLSNQKCLNLKSIQSLLFFSKYIIQTKDKYLFEKKHEKLDDLNKVIKD